MFLPFSRFILILCPVLLFMGCTNKKVELEQQRIDERISDLELRVRENESRLYRNLEKKFKAAQSDQAQPVLEEEMDPAQKEAPEMDGAYESVEPETVEPETVEPPSDSDAPKEADVLEEMSTSAPDTPHEPLTNVKGLYKESLEHLYARRYEQAEMGFRAIADRSQTHPLAPNAAYWLAEVSYSQYNFNHAVLLFARVVERYPESGKAPDAMLKLAMCRDRLGQRKEALGEYRLLIERYPKSDAAAKARERL